MLKRLNESTFIIFIRNMNKWLLGFTTLNLIWVFCYKVWLINIRCDLNIMPALGEIYFSIALSIVAGYIIFLITSEYPEIRRLKKFRSAYWCFILVMHDFRFNLCTNFNIEKDEYKKPKIYRGDIENKIKYLIENKNIEITILKNVIDETVNGIRNKFLESSNLFRSFPDSFYTAYFEFQGVELLLFKELSDERFALAENFCHLINFLNSTIRKGSNDLLKLGSDKKHVEYLE